MPFRDRREAGRRLAERLSGLRASSPLVLGLPRGGVPVAFEIATALGVLLDIFLVRKLGVPSQPELAMGAIASGGVRVLNDEVVCARTPALFSAVGLWYRDFSQTTDDEVRELLERSRAFAAKEK